MDYTNHPLNNKVILCTKENQGQPLKDFFERNGIDEGFCKFDTVGIFYGVVNGAFIAWSSLSFYKYNLEIITIYWTKPKVDFKTRAMMAATIYASIYESTVENAVNAADELIKELEK